MNTLRVLKKISTAAVIAGVLLAVPKAAMAADSFSQSLRPVRIATLSATPQPSDSTKVEMTSLDDGSAVATNSPVTKVAAGQPSSSDPLLILTGPASYYSEAGCLGCNAALRMANGQTLDDSRATVAIPAHLVRYVGRTARLTNMVNNKTIMVPITDTGGFYAAKYNFRVADMSVATKLALGISGGMGHVKLEIF